MIIEQQHFTDLLKTIVDLNTAVIKKRLPSGDSPMYSINVLKKHWQSEFPLDINKCLCYSCYDYKKTDAVVILRYGKNLKSFTREQIKLGCLSEMISRIIQWINKDSIWIDKQIEYVKELIESDYDIKKL